MEIFTVSLFGHRRIDDLNKLENKLAPVIRELIQSKSYVAFLVGRNGEFDEYVASVIKRVQNKIEYGSSDITLVLPYSVADISYYEEYYDNIVIPECLYKVHPKSAIKLKNQWMVDQSEMVICWVERKEGGAYTAMKYAEKSEKYIINLHE